MDSTRDRSSRTASAGESRPPLRHPLSRSAAVAASSLRTEESCCLRSPDLNPFRHPLWGRGQEVPSEDPLLCGRYGAGYVSGLQGKDDPEGQGYLRLVASPKHFVGYDTEGMGPVSSGCVDAGTGQPGTGCTFSGPTFNRHNFTANISAQELVEYYALPFQHAIVDGGAMGLMCTLATTWPSLEAERHLE